MKKSRYFSELLKSYLDELDDLQSDSEGKTVLQKRLREKRGEMKALLAMIEYSPEMVAVVFYEAFEFTAPEALHKLVQNEPEFSAYPGWAKLKSSLKLAPWAEPLVATTLAAEGGDAFLVATAGLEFLRLKDGFAAQESWADTEEDEDDETDDLGEAGSEWLSEQGFESLEN